MALPLPSVVYNVEPGGGIVTGMRGTNALTKSALDNQIAKAQAQYAPYTAYADAASKIAYSNLLPYQIQAQVMSNPLLWMAMKDNPGAMQSMMNNFAQSVPKGNQIFGNIDLPAPNTMTPQSNGLMDIFLGKILPESQSASNNPMQSIPSNDTNVNVPSQANTTSNGQYSRLVPATKGGYSGVTAKMTAPYNAEVQKPGTTFRDENTGEVVSSPTEGTRTSFQSSINAAKRVEPQLKALAKEAAPFMTAGGYAKMQIQRGKNYLGIGKEGKLPSQYAKFQSLIQSSPEALVKAYGLRPTNETIDRMQKVIEPYVGETKEGYKNRILKTLEEIKNEQISISSQQLSQGFTVGDENKPAEGVKKLSSEITFPKFNSKQEFQDWYGRQTKMVQDAVKLHLRNKE